MRCPVGSIKCRQNQAFPHERRLFISSDYPRLPAALVPPRGGPGVPDEKECFFRKARSVTVQPRYPLAPISAPGRPGNLPLGLPATLFP